MQELGKFAQEGAFVFLGVPRALNGDLTRRAVAWMPVLRDPKDMDLRDATGSRRQTQSEGRAFLLVNHVAADTLQVG